MNIGKKKYETVLIQFNNLVGNIESNAGDEVLRVFWLGMLNGFISAYGEENFPESLVDRWKIIYKQMKLERSLEK